MQNKKIPFTIRKLALYGLLISLAMILSFVESLLPINLGIPGVKLGLANLATIVALYTLGIYSAFAISIIRIILIAFTFGNFSNMLFAMSGALLSIFFMILTKKSSLFSTTGVSIAGGVSHNIGQIIAAGFIVRTVGVIAYLPFLLIAGSISGAVIGILAAMIINRIKPEVSKMEV